MNHEEFVNFCKKHIKHLEDTDDGTADRIIEAARKGKNTKKKKTPSSEQDRV